MLGLLYGLGAAVESARLADAHVAVLDGLPLVPLPHLLTVGIGLLFSTVVSLAVVTVFVLLLRRIERWVSGDSFRTFIQRRRRTIDTRLFRIKSEIRSQRDAVSHQREVVQRIKDIGSTKFPTSVTTTEKAELLATIEGLKDEAEHFDERVEETTLRFRRFQRRWKIVKRRNRADVRLLHGILFCVKYGPLFSAIVVGFFLLPPAVAIGLMLSGIVWRVGLHFETRSLLLTLYVIVSIGVIANGLINVKSLPIAYVTTTNGSFHGRLVALTDTAWYIADPDGVIRSISTDRVQSGFTVSVSAPRVRTLFQLVEDKL